ncbi:MAG: alpha-L-arabinofuranosidase [Chitinophagaceae bacterium]|nr:alpha-L-arabinofuranosidase [Chitinophagaceae bacterium]
MKRRLFVLFLLPIFVTAQYRVELTKVRYPVQSTMWGLFYEDINRSGDGGLYGDIMKNRSFDFPEAFMGWITVPSRSSYAKNEIFQIIKSGNENNPKYLQVTKNSKEPVLLANEGFGGVAVGNNQSYELIVVYRQRKEGLILKAEINNSKNVAVGLADIFLDKSTEWKTYRAVINTTDSANNGKLLFKFDGIGQIDIDRVSLFPLNTWQNRKEGLRNDLVQKIAAIKPGFMRFPGGCIVEGDNINTRYQWKHTIGPISERKLNSNQWSSGGASGRKMPDYFQSYGLGFYEYFLLCKDMGAEPMPIINAGLSCQFGAGEVVGNSSMDEYIQDALDLIEFANGNTNTLWGAKRLALGHAEPFNLKMLGIGNENWGPQYVERLEMFTKAIKAKYPTLQLITSTGYSPNPQFRYMDSVLRKMNVDIIDEHYYQTPNWFLMNAGKYDHYDRKGPKIFLGEYACHSVRIGNTGNKNTQLCALAEAAFMTGLERNADIVIMAAYAPLFAHINDWQWTPNLIWFDNRNSYATPSYYVQQLFSLNKGTDVVPLVHGPQTTDDGKTISGQDSVWASAVIDKKTNELIIKLVNPSGTVKNKSIEIPDLKSKVINGTVTVLKGNSGDVNSLEKEVVVPVTTSISVKGKKLNVVLDAYSFSVVRVKM